MNRWLFAVTILFSFGIVAAAPPPAKPAPSKVEGKPVAVGDTVSLAAKPSTGPVIILPQPRLGDPDKPDFENGCQLRVPFEARVLGLLPDPVAEAVIVVDYHASAKDLSSFYCRDGAVLLFSRDGWATLKAAEAAVAQERAAQDRRREAVRKILRQSGRAADRK